MPLITLSTVQLILLIFIISPLVELAAVLVGRKVPLSKLNTEVWLYRTRKWENNGDFYRKFLKVHKWKKYLPDGAKCFKDDFEKNSLRHSDPKYLDLFISETCRAELVHWLMLVPFFFYYLIAPPIIATALLLVVLFVNGPCIVAQRYNRPRLKSAMEKKISLLKIAQEDDEDNGEELRHQA